jgi:hypothetical protein
VTSPDRPEPDPDEPLTPPDDEQEPDWAEQIRALRRERGAGLGERHADEDPDQERPIPDL